MTGLAWVVFCHGLQGPDTYTLVCKRCGAGEKVQMPISRLELRKQARRFEQEHAGCKRADTTDRRNQVPLTVSQ